MLEGATADDEVVQLAADSSSLVAHGACSDLPPGTSLTR
jgi:hypothetical protein